MKLTIEQFEKYFLGHRQEKLVSWSKKDNAYILDFNKLADLMDKDKSFNLKMN